MPELTAVPSLDELVKDPSGVAGLAPETARTLWFEIITLEKSLAMRALMTVEQSSTAPTPTKWLTVEQVEAQYGLKARWLYANKAKLPYSQPSKKVLLFNEEKLVKWLAAHKGS